jgi:hypothetical protein
MAVYSAGSILVHLDEKFCLRKKCPHENNYHLADVFPEEFLRLSYATHSCIDCTALFGECMDCEKMFSEKTLKRYRGRCGKCLKKRREKLRNRRIIEDEN